MDISVYAEISNQLKLSQYLSVKDNPINVKDLLTMIGKSVSKTTGSSDLSSLKNETIDLIKNKLQNKVSNQILQSLLKKIVIAKLGGEDKLALFAVENGAAGLDFAKSKLLDDGSIEINLKYNLLIKAMNLFTQNRKICQRAYIQTNIKASEDRDNGKESIWNETNFNRGRFFANYLRENSSSLVIQSGQGLDLYNKGSKTVSQMFSMNVFKPSYSEKKADSYKLKMKEIQKQINQYCKDAKENLQKSKGKLTLDKGQIINVDTNSKIELLLIMPNEAKDYSELNQLKGLMPQGFSLKILYMEDALK